MDLHKLKKLVTFCRKNGIKYIKNEEIELEIELRLVPKKPDMHPVLDNTQQITNQPTEDELLYWSTDYSPAEAREEPAQPQA